MLKQTVLLTVSPITLGWVPETFFREIEFKIYNFVTFFREIEIQFVILPLSHPG